MKKIAMMGSIHEDGWNFLKSKGYNVFEITDFREENVIDKLENVDGICLRTSKLNSKVLKHCNNLKIVSRHGVGYDNVDLDYLNLNNQALAITGTSNAVSVSELVMTMFLYLLKKINLSDDLVKSGNFKNKNLLPDFFEIYNKNILILGFGRIGQALAQRCLGFDCNVYVYDPFIDKKEIEDKKCHKINFKEGLEIADLISVHLPLNEKTRDLISKKEFKLMRGNCIIINSARGGIINEHDLLEVLKNKKILGAGLDVYKKEPPPEDDPLYKLDNVILTPHNAALTLECRKRMATEMAENIFYYLESNSNLNISNIVNKKNLNL